MSQTSEHQPQPVYTPIPCQAADDIAPKAHSGIVTHERQVNCENKDNVQVRDNNLQWNSFFDRIRIICESNESAEGAAPDPYKLAPHRANFWPRAVGLPDELSSIYDSVRRSGLPNALGVRREIPSNLNIEAWEKTFGHDSKYREMLDFVRYGFPMGYMGPVSKYDDHINQTSATQHG